MSDEGILLCPECRQASWIPIVKPRQPAVPVVVDLDEPGDPSAPSPEEKIRLVDVELQTAYLILDFGDFFDRQQGVAGQAAAPSAQGLQERKPLQLAQGLQEREREETSGSETSLLESSDDGSDDDTSDDMAPGKEHFAFTFHFFFFFLFFFIVYPTGRRGFKRQQDSKRRPLFSHLKDELAATFRKRGPKEQGTSRTNFFFF